MTDIHATDIHARLASLYDGDNPDGPDHDWYRALVRTADARAVLDIGCGTGILTVTLVGDGRRVVGVDPSPPMLDIARTREGGDAVTWIDGDSAAIAGGPFDVAIMSGNVAQHITGDAWPRTLTDLRAAMPVGGLLAFETRNPAARAWEGWTSSEPSRRATAYGLLEESSRAEEISPGVVRLTCSNHFVATDELVTVVTDLAFRSVETLRADLTAAGFEMYAVAGGFAAQPLTDAARLLVVSARAV